MRIALGIFIAALATTPALASESAQSELIRWVSENTDMPAAQIAIAGPDRAYSVERLGPPAPTGEVIALVRAEGLKADWVGPQGFRSWDAHIIFDCKAQRMRVIRSASYPAANRGGEPKAETRIANWFAPSADEPGAQLLAAACDAAFDWPLRAKMTVAKAWKTPVIEEGVTRRKADAEGAAAGAEDPAAPAADEKPAASDAGAAAKPAVELASLPLEPPVSPASAETVEAAQLAAVEFVDRPSLTAGPEVRDPTVVAPSKRRLASLFSPFARFASLGKRLFADGTRLAGLSHGRAGEQHASLGEEATRKVAHFARAGPGSE